MKIATLTLALVGTANAGYNSISTEAAGPVSSAGNWVGSELRRLSTMSTAKKQFSFNARDLASHGGATGGAASTTPSSSADAEASDATTTTLGMFALAIFTAAVFL